MKLCSNISIFNKSFAKTALCTAILAAASSVVAEEKSYSSLQEFMKGSKVTGDLNLRFESFDNETVTSDALTLRSRFGFKTPSYKGFSAQVEAEDVRDVFGIDEKVGIPDPEVTEIDQAYIQYKNDTVTTKFGRQVITLDGHRFVGHVGWRQDRQTYDAVRAIFTPAKGLTIDTSYLYQRNRIFGETADAKSSDLLLNVSYKAPFGKLVGYYYSLDDDNVGVPFPESDTFGASIDGATKGDVSFIYRAEFASQTINLDTGPEYDTDFYNLEAGIKFSGVTVKVGQELLGSDDGMASFTTPLATLHKFNGWSDVTLGGVFNPVAMPAGLIDTYVTVGTKLFGTKLAAFYHTFEADESVAGSDDYGTELNLLAVKPLKGGFVIGAKYAKFSDEEANATFGSDVERFWVWTGFKF